jgi:hypothetical protein
LAPSATADEEHSTFSAENGFALRQGSGNGASTSVEGLEDTTESTAGSFAGKFTYSDTSGSWAAVFIALES